MSYTIDSCYVYEKNICSVLNTTPVIRHYCFFVHVFLSGSAPAPPDPNWCSNANKKWEEYVGLLPFFVQILEFIYEYLCTLNSSQAPQPLKIISENNYYVAVHCCDWIMWRSITVTQAVVSFRLQYCTHVRLHSSSQ